MTFPVFVLQIFSDPRVSSFFKKSLLLLVVERSSCSEIAISRTNAQTWHLTDKCDIATLLGRNSCRPMPCTVLLLLLCNAFINPIFGPTTHRNLQFVRFKVYLLRSSLQDFPFCVTTLPKSLCQLQSCFAISAIAAVNLPLVQNNFGMIFSLYLYYHALVSL